MNLEASTEYKRTSEGYLEYLKSDHWKSLRSAAFKRDGYKCTKCPRRDHLEAHHLLYRADWSDTRLSDLVTLCEDCHEAQHPALRVNRPAVLPDVEITPGASAWLASGIQDMSDLVDSRSRGLISRDQFNALKASYQQLPQSIKRYSSKPQRMRRIKRKRRGHPGDSL